jgi:hypothetical protein
MLNRVRVPLLADIPNGKRCDCWPQRVVRCEHPVVPMPVPPGRRDQRHQIVKKLKRRQLDDTTGPGPRRLPRASRANPVPALVPGQDVANPLRAVARARHNRKPIERKGWPGTVTQQMLQALEVPRHVPVSKRDPNACINGESAVLPYVHVGRGLTAEKTLPAKPPHQPQPYPLGHCCQI